MHTLMAAPALAEEMRITLFKVRRYTKLGILTPVSKDRKDGKTLLYDPRCAAIKLELLDNLRLDFSLAELGDKFRKVFGRRNAVLIKALQKISEKEDLISHFEKEIESL